MEAQVIRERARRNVTLSVIAASGVGSAIVFVFLAWLLPLPRSGTGEHDTPLWLNASVLVVYLAVTQFLGRRWGDRLGDRRLCWIAENRPPTTAEQRGALRLPVDQLRIPAVGWGGAALLFGLINLTHSEEEAGRIATTIVLGGFATCAFSYLLAERGLREVASLALATGPPLRPVAPGIVVRVVLAWALATGIPLVGIALTMGGVLHGDTPLSRGTAGAVLFLAAAGLVLGAAAMVAAARTIAAPVRAVRAGLARVEAGDDDTEVAVWDASEVGLLQAGFNRMAAGLRERERLRDLFGRHVGEDVAVRALEHGFELGGEEREAAALFVDVVGSTRLATERAAAEVVAMLNEFFSLVVETTAAHGGWVNKFEGDAALCVFGVPAPGTDPAGDALAAARELTVRLGRECRLEAAIGVSFGPVVAGNVGAASRLEYTVLGDAVNEAARLTELAKDREPRVLASATAVARARDTEASAWRLEEEVVLRGRAQPTRLATPAAPRRAELSAARASAPAP